MQNQGITLTVPTVLVSHQIVNNRTILGIRFVLLQNKFLLTRKTHYSKMMASARASLGRLITVCLHLSQW